MEEENPIKHLVDDETFMRLSKAGVLNKTAVRNFAIKLKFTEMRKEKKSVQLILALLHQEYPYVGYEALRKIIYDKTINVEIRNGKS